MATEGAVVKRAAVDVAELEQVLVFLGQGLSPEELEAFQARMKERKVSEMGL
jgi:hypothetical protein